MLSGDNGILQKATDAKEKTERAEIIETAQMDVLSKITENHGENLTEDELEEILIKYGTLSDNGESSILEKTLLTENGNEIAVNEIYDKELKINKGVWAKLYDVDGIGTVLVLDNHEDFNYSQGTLKKSYDKENQEFLKSNNKTVWNEDVESINQVFINGTIYPDITKGYFNNCINLTNISNIKKLKTSEVTAMDEMFSNCKMLENIDVSGFDTKKVTDMTAMFYGCEKIEGIDVSRFDARSLTRMSAMFSGCKSLKELNLENFYSNKCERNGIGYLCYNCTELEKLTLPEFMKITDMSGFMPMIGATGIKYLDISGMVTSNVTNMTAMFSGCSNLEEIKLKGEGAGILAFDTSKVLSMNSMFNGCKSLKSIDLSDFQSNKVNSMQAMFYGCESLTQLDLTPLGDNVCTTTTSISGIVAGCTNLESLTLCNFKKMNNYSNFVASILGGNKNVKHISLGNMDTSEVTDMSYMFCACDSVEDINLKNLNTSNVTNMSGMFTQCKALKSIDLSKINTSKLNNCSNMFQDCESLTNINLANFNTSQVTNMTCMFYGCKSLTELDLTSFNTQKATSMQAMFYNDGNLTLIKVGDGWDYTGNGSDARGNSMYYNCGTNSVTK